MLPSGGSPAGTGGMGGGGSGGTGGIGGTGGMEPSRPPIEGPEPSACEPDVASGAIDSARTVLFSGSEPLTGLTARRGELYARDAIGIVRWREGATALERVSSGAGGPLLAGGLRLYWVEGGSAYRVSFDANDEAPDVVASVMAPATFLQNDENNLYYWHATSRSVWQQPLDGSAPTAIVTGADVDALQLHGGALYYASGKSVTKHSVEPGSEPSAALEEAPRFILAMQTDGIDLVWTDSLELMRVALDAPDQLRKLSQGGPDGTERARITGFTIFGNHVYFIDDAGNVGRARRDTTECTLLVADAGTLHAIVADDDAVYVSAEVGASHELWRLTP
jgi:hypothetical protein